MINIFSVGKLPQAIKPTKEFKNVLPVEYRYWNELFEEISKIAKSDKIEIPEQCELNIIEVQEEPKSFVYHYDLDFIKARCFEEFQEYFVKEIDYMLQQNPIYIGEAARFIRVYQTLTRK